MVVTDEEDVILIHPEMNMESMRKMTIKNAGNPIIARLTQTFGTMAAILDLISSGYFLNSQNNLECFGCGVGPRIHAPGCEAAVHNVRENAVPLEELNIHLRVNIQL